MIKAPKFWWNEHKFYPSILWVFSRIYAYFANSKFSTTPKYKFDKPVLCIGNFTMGGNGKTPLARQIYKEAQKQGFTPVILMRGYKGRCRVPCVVDIAMHDESYVGDEAMLLAQECEVIVAPKRYQALPLLQAYDFIILDDGFQSRNLYYDFSVIAIDAGRAFGNGMVFPSGPLRADLNLQLRYADALMFIDGNVKLPHSFKAMSYQAKITLMIKKGSSFDFGRRVYGFCAIGNAKKFYKSLQDVGLEVKLFKEFPDHHKFSSLDIEKLRKAADKEGLALATTSKDYTKLNGYNIENLYILDIEICPVNKQAFKEIISNTVQAYKVRNRLCKEASQSI